MAATKGPRTGEIFAPSVLNAFSAILVLQTVRNSADLFLKLVVATDAGLGEHKG